MISGSIVSIFSAIFSIIAISIALNIFKKVYQEDYKKPWLYIALSIILLGISQILKFLSGIFSIYIYDTIVHEYVTYLLEFFSIVILAYAILLEYLILEYYKGKFVKMKFIPVQEGSIGGELDINVSKGKGYFAFKKNKKFMFEQFASATKSGFEGFLLTETNPREIRMKYNVQKTPIAWISEIDSGTNSNYVKSSLDENSDVVEPLQLNNIISFIDNFLEQSHDPFIMIDLDTILKVNSFSVSEEFLKYIATKTEKFNGVLVYLLNTDILKKNELAELRSFLVELD